MKAPGQILVSTYLKSYTLHSFPLFLSNLSVPNFAYFFLRLNRPFAKKEEEKKKEKMKAASASFSGEGNRDREKNIEKSYSDKWPFASQFFLSFPSPPLSSCVGYLCNRSNNSPAAGFAKMFLKSFPPDFFFKIW